MTDEMAGSFDITSSPDVVAHVIQVALAPVFLLSGIATLLNVFSARLARVSDLVRQLTDNIGDADGEEAMSIAVQLTRLRRRSIALDIAVILGAIGGEQLVPQS